MAKPVAQLGPLWWWWAWRWWMLSVLVMLGFGMLSFAAGDFQQKRFGQLSGVLCCFSTVGPGLMIGLFLSWMMHHSQSLEVIEYGKLLGWRGTAWRVRCRFPKMRSMDLLRGTYESKLREGLLGASGNELVAVPTGGMWRNPQQISREEVLERAMRWPLSAIAAVEFKPPGGPWKLLTHGGGAIHLLLEDGSWVELWTEHPRHAVELFRAVVERARERGAQD